MAPSSVYKSSSTKFPVDFRDKNLGKFQAVLMNIYSFVEHSLSLLQVNISSLNCTFKSGSSWNITMILFI